MHLQRTLPVNSASVSALTIYTVRTQLICQCTYTAHCKCNVLHAHTMCKCCALRVPLLHNGGANCAAGRRGADVKCTARAPCAPHCCAEEWPNFSQNFQEFCFFLHSITDMAYCCTRKFSAQHYAMPNS